jgi:YD repeat-containing protein
MARNASAPRARLARLVLCLSLLAQPLLSGLTNASASRSAGNGNPPVSNRVAVRQEAEAADLPDLNEARNRPHHEPHAIPPVPSTRRRCPPRNRRCNDDVDGKPHPAPTPWHASLGRDNATSLASVTTQSLLAVLSAAMNGGRPVFDVPLLDYFSNDGGYSVSDSATSSGTLPPLYVGAAAPLAQAQPNASVFVAQSVPTVMQVGQQYNVAVTMRNTGTNTWTSATSYNLSSQNPQDNSTWGMTRVPLPSSVAPGTEVTFTFTVTAPATPGTYNFQWRMVQDGVAWFGDYTPNVSVTVASAAMVGRWRFDDGSGSAAVDSSGNGNTGTLRNGPAWVTGTVGTGALDFDGVDDSVSVPGSATINAVKNNFTVSFWANPRSTHEIDAESTTGASGVSGQRYVWGPNWYDYNNGGAGAGISVGTNGVSVYEHGPNYMPSPLVYQGMLSGWTHVTIVYQNKQPRLYINGTRVRTGLTSPKTSVGVIPWDFGGMPYGYYNGQLDDVRLYNGVLTDGEITALANTPGRLVASWKFDEGSGTTASDATGNGSTGTLQNGPAWVAGKVGAGALNFDGVNDGITVSSSAALTSVSNDFAITFWANPRSAHEIDPEGTTGVSGVSGQRYAFGPLNYGTTSEVGAGVSVGTNGVSVYEHGAGYMPATLVYQGTLSGWTHVAVVYENRQPKLYLNGTLVRVGYTSPASTVRVAPWNLGGNSYGYFDGQLDDVRVFKGALTASDVQALYGGQGTGLTGEYYDNIDFTGYTLTRTDPTVSFDWGNNAPTASMGNDQFSVRWAGTLVPKYSETYTFYTTTDDGVRLWIDGQLLIDKWVDQGPTEWTGQMTLEAGRAYAVRMEFYENFGGAQAKLSWSSASQGKEIIPQTQLNGCWKDVGQFARDFYQAALARQPYAFELTEWTENLTQAQSDDGLVATAQTLGANVFNSSEYAARNRSDVDYVSDLYWAYLQRAPDASGLSFWSGSIIACGSDKQCRAAQRANARMAFDQSGEFKEKVKVLCGTSTAAPVNGGVGYDFSTARLDPNNRTGGEGVDPYSRNLNFSIPILSLPGRAGLDLGLALTYNSLVWTKDSTAVTYDVDGGFPGPGFRLGFPLIEPKFVNPQLQQAGQPTRYSYLLLMPSGGRVELRQVGTSSVYESADSSYLQLVESGGAPQTLLSTDGTQMSFALANGEYRCCQMKDRNGNYLSVAYYSDGRIDKVTDTLGRMTTFNYDSYQNLISITQPWKRETEANPTGVDEEHKWATFGYTNLTLQPSFSNLAVMGDQPGMIVPVLSQVGLDDGSYYKFYYNQWGQVWKVAHFAADSVTANGQPNDSHALNYTRYDLPGSDLSAATPQTDCPRFTQERTWVENGIMNQSAEVTSSYGPWASNMASCDVTKPDGTVYRDLYATSGWQRGLTTESHVLSGTQEKKWTTFSWTQDNTSVAYAINPRITETVINDVEGNYRRTVVSYQTFALPDGVSCSMQQELTEYDTNGTTPLRTTHTDYNLAPEYLNRRIIGLPSFVKMYDGTSAGTLMAKTGYVYDDVGYMDNDPLQPNYLEALPSTASQHDGTNYGVSFVWRGNATRVRHYDVTGSANTFIESKSGYNVTGTLAFIKDPSNHLAAMSYTDSFYQNVNRTNANPQNQLKTFAYPTTVTDPDGFTATTIYNYDMGLVAQTQTPLPNTTQNQPGPITKFLYDIAHRPIKTSRVDGATEKGYMKFIYPDSMRYVQTLTLLDTGIEGTALKTLDGLGRVRGLSADLPGTSGGHSGQLFYMDSMGRIVRTSNPIEIDANWNPAGDDAAAGWIFTEQTYDWKGRPRKTTKPKLDPNNSNEQPAVSEIVYEGCGCAGGGGETITGEVVPTAATDSSQGQRKQKIYRDVLGREIKRETYAWDGTNIYATLTKEYTARDQLKYIKEYRGAATTDGSCPTGSNGTCQLTTMSYDGYGRLTSEQRPEETHASIYTYNDDDTVQTFTDARGAKAQFTYNGRHMLGTVSYNLSNLYAGQSVAQTSGVTYTYDGAGNRTRMDDGQGWTTYTYNNLSQMQSESRYFNDLGRAFSLSYADNFVGKIKSVTDPFGATASYVYDQAGHLSVINASGYSGVSQFVTSTGYKAWGAVKSISYGNTRTLSVGYNRRMEPTSYNVPGVMSKTYDYSADGRMRFMHDLDDNKFDRLYVYDQAGRLTLNLSGADARAGAPTTSDRPYYEEYQYDERDHLTNRYTEHWSKHPGYGFVHQYINNRNTLWQYDGSGDVTGGDGRTYSYDAARRLVSQNTSTFNFAQGFDGDGNRVKSVEANVATYYVNSTALGGSVVAELDNTGNRSQAYVYAGGKVLATVSANGSVIYRHDDLQNVSVRGTGPTGVMSGEVSELDPSRADVETADPYVGNTNYRGRDDSGPLFPAYGNVTSPSSGCTLDGVWVPCEMAMRGLRSGAATVDTRDGEPPPIAGGVWVPVYGRACIQSEDAYGVHVTCSAYISDYSWNGAIGANGFANGPDYNSRPNNLGQDVSELKTPVTQSELNFFRPRVMQTLNTDTCQNFLQQLFDEVAKQTGRPRADVMTTFDRSNFYWERQEGPYGGNAYYEHGKPAASIDNAFITNRVVEGSPEGIRDRRAFLTKETTQAFLAETLHAVGSPYGYDDAEMASALNAIRVRQGIDTPQAFSIRSSVEIYNASVYWHPRVSDACPGPRN